jgi:hypothetical protein
LIEMLIKFRLALGYLVRPLHAVPKNLLRRGRRCFRILIGRPQCTFRRSRRASSCLPAPVPDPRYPCTTQGVGSRPATATAGVGVTNSVIFQLNCGHEHFPGSQDSSVLRAAVPKDGGHSRLAPGARDVPAYTCASHRSKDPTSSPLIDDGDFRKCCRPTLVTAQPQPIRRARERDEEFQHGEPASGTSNLTASAKSRGQNRQTQDRSRVRQDGRRLPFLAPTGNLCSVQP